MGETNVYGKYCNIFVHSNLVSEDKGIGQNVSLQFDLNETFEHMKEAGGSSAFLGKQRRRQSAAEQEILIRCCLVEEENVCPGSGDTEQLEFRKSAAMWLAVSEC